MPRHLILTLDAPLMAFGGETIDNYGVIRPFPAKSMICGLLANALGYARHEGERLQALQDRLRIGSRLDAPGIRLRDYQTALLFENDASWTTRGRREGRASSPSYKMKDGRKQLTWQRYRDYHADARLIVALRLEPADEDPSFDDIASALNEPARPLFLGRKPCLPAERLVRGFVDADAIHGALAAADGSGRDLQAQWPEGEGPRGQNHRRICDERNWVSGLHGGDRPVVEGLISPRNAEAAT
jgi:CRISPR system Cascade subunit CasD